MGAGASKPFGIPLTREILPLILESIDEQNLFMPILLKNRKGERVENDYSAETRREMETDLRDFLFGLLPGLRSKFAAYKTAAAEERQTISFPLITEILSLVDHLSINNNVPFFNPAASPGMGKVYASRDLAYYRKLLDRAIYEILAEKRNYTPEEESKRSAFAAYVVQEIINGNQVSLITTNYDTAAEMKIYEESIKAVEQIDFGFSWRPVNSEDGAVQHQPSNTRLKILKLHGSLNWLKCDLCDHVYINPKGNIIHQAFRDEIDDRNTCHCNNAPLKSLIVAPSFERDVRDSNLLHIWKTALETLREAEEWIMIGYSLPAEDLAIKSLLVRAKNSRSNPLKKEQVTIVQHGNSAKESYSLLFGEDGFSYLANGLDEFLDQVKTSSLNNTFREFTD